MSWLHFRKVVGDLAFRRHSSKNFLEFFPFGVKLHSSFFQAVDVNCEAFLRCGGRLPIFHKEVVQTPTICDTYDRQEVRWQSPGCM